MQLTERGEIVIGNLTERGELVIGALTATGRTVIGSSASPGGPDWSTWEDQWPGYRNTPRPPKPRRPTESWLPIVIKRPIKDDDFELFLLGLISFSDLLLGGDETAIEQALIFGPASIGVRAPAMKAFKAVGRRDAVDRLLDSVDAEARRWAEDATAGAAAVKAVDRRDAVDRLLDAVDSEARRWAMDATKE